MVRSQLPVPSLLRRFHALLMLSLEPPKGIPEGLSNLPVTDRRVQKILAFAVEKYNQDRVDSANYLKVLRVREVQTQVINPVQYHLMLDLVKTTCEKKAEKNLQLCNYIPHANIRNKPVNHTLHLI